MEIAEPVTCEQRCGDGVDGRDFTDAAQDGRPARRGESIGVAGSAGRIRLSRFACRRGSDTKLPPFARTIWRDIAILRNYAPRSVRIASGRSSQVERCARLATRRGRCIFITY